MAGKDDYRIFVGGLAWDVTERQLERTFGRFGKIIECQVFPVEGFVAAIPTANFLVRPHCQIFILFGKLHGADSLQVASHNSEDLVALIDVSTKQRNSCSGGRESGKSENRRGMEDAIREMHGRELGDRIISVNKAEPKMSDDLNHGSYRGSYSGGGRGNYSGGGGGGGERSFGQDECFKCGRLGHWARECPSAGGGGARGGGGAPPPFSSHLRYGAAGDRFGERERYLDDRYDGGRYGERDRFDSRDMKYPGRERYVGDRFPPGGDRFASDRYGGSDRYPQNGFGKDRGYERDVGPRGVGDRYGGGGPARTDDRSYRSRPGPYDRPSRGRPSSFERY